MKKAVLKKAVALVAVTVMMLSFGATTVMANNPWQAGACPGGGFGMMGGMMWDDDGNFLSREAFEQRLDGWIAEGRIPANNRAFFLERFDFCLAYGGGAGEFGACVGFGAGTGMMGGRGMMRGSNWN